MFKKFMSKKRNKKRGFTLIELIIVIAIIAILAAIAVPAFGNVTKNANINTDIANARTIYSVATAEIAEGNEIEDIDDLEGLEKIPTPKANSGSFVIDVDSDDKVTVSISVPGASEGQAATIIDVYPTPTADSDYDK